MTFSEWNAAYVKALQKMNALMRQFNDAWKDPAAQKRIAPRVQAAKDAVEAIRAHPDRPASRAMGNTSRMEVNS